MRRIAAVACALGALIAGGARAAEATHPCRAAGASPYDRPALSADGSILVFTTSAALVPGDTNHTLDVYSRTSDGAVQLISVTAGGKAGAGRSSAPSISTDGRFVAFQSDATDLVANDDPAGVTDVFVRDRATGATELISVAPGGARASAASGRPAISPDGSMVAFESMAANLVAGDTNALTDVFVRDRAAGTTRRVSVATDGSQADGLGSFAPSISDTGRIAFHSTASAWVTPGEDLRSFLRDGIYYVRNVYVHDLADRTTTHVSVTTDGSPPDGLSLYPSISRDGTRVAFLSSSTNLVPGDTNNRPDVKGFAQSDVFVRDLAAGTTTRVSVDSDGREASGLGSSGAVIDAGGRRVVFESAAPNLDFGDINRALDVFVHDTVTHITKRVSETEDGEEAGFAGALAFGSVAGSLSGDGRTVAFVSSAPGLVGHGTGQSPHPFGVFVRSISDGTLTGPIGIGCDSAHAPERAAAAPATIAAQPFDSSWLVPGVLALVGILILTRRPRGRVAFALALALGSLGIAPAGAHHHAPIQPGAPVLRDTGFGTASLNFVFRDRGSGALYVGTAAHAVREHWVGDRVASDELGEFGTLVYSREGVFSFSTQDFALIRIDPDKYEMVEPAVRHWGGPTGVARLSELVPGLPTYQYGQGSFFRTSEPTRLKPGVVSYVLPDNWGYVGWVGEARGGFGGDSGSPILVGPDGRALAVTILFASALYGDPSVQMGPSIELIVQELRLAGFDVELVTAPFHGPAGDVAGMVTHCTERPIEGPVLNDGCVRPGSDL